MNNRTTSLANILSMTSCLEDYNLNHPVLVEFLISAIGEITLQEITDYCTEAYLSEEARSKGYGEEDYEFRHGFLIEVLKPIIQE